MANVETMKAHTLNSTLEKVTSHEQMSRLLNSEYVRDKMNKINKRQTAVDDEIKLYQLVLAKLEGKTNDEHANNVAALKDEHKIDYDQMTNIAEKDKPKKISETREAIQNLRKTIEKNDTISDTAKKAVEKAQQSWLGKIWSSVKKFGSDVIDGITYIPRKIGEGVKSVYSKIKEFVQSRRGKKILKYTALAVGVAALGALALWLIGAPLGSGSGKLYETARNGLLKLIDKLGLGWKFPPGLEDTI